MTALDDALEAGEAASHISLEAAMREAIATYLDNVRTGTTAARLAEDGELIRCGGDPAHLHGYRGSQ